MKKTGLVTKSETKITTAFMGDMISMFYHKARTLNTDNEITFHKSLMGQANPNLNYLKQNREI